MRKTFKYRLYPTQTQQRTLDDWLTKCRRLYNAMLEQRQIAWKMGHRVDYYDQQRELKTIKKEFPEYAQIGAHVLVDVTRRLDTSFRRFFKGAGYPKFQDGRRYHSFTFPDYCGWKLKEGKLLLTNCSAVNVKWSRPVEGDIKTVTIKRTKAGEWFVCFSCDNVPSPQYPATDKSVGIDLGIEALATTSDGERIENAQYLKRKLKRLRCVQRHLARQKKGSQRREKTVRQLARLHEHIANQRRDAHHKASTKLVRENAEIHMERIDPAFMLANKRLARSAADVGWGQFKMFLHSKAAAAGRNIVEKNPAYTSQECSGCGQLVPKKLWQRWHRCECGTSLHRDHNAAIVILNRPA